MKPLTVPFILLFLFAQQLFSQTILSKPLVIEKPAVVRKIAWVDAGKFCLVSDRMTQGGFLHFISVFDSSGKTVHPIEKIYTKYSLQHEYFLVLENMLFFFDHLTNEYGEEKFRLMGTVKEDSTLNEKETDIFNIRGTTERKFLNEKKYNFKVYRGANGKKALLTYNNDYKGEIKEGFRYRIIDCNGKLSEEQKLELPYVDRLCNIEDVVYDDFANKVYMLCDLFNSSDDKNRTFNNSFVALFDLNIGKYSEIKTDIPSFYNNKIQHCVDQSNISFSSLGFNEDNAEGWTTSFLTLNKDLFEVKDHQFNSINTDTIKNFFGANKKLLSKFILPLNFIQTKSGNFTIGWNFFYDLDFRAEGEKDRTQTINMYGAMFGIWGAAISAAVTQGDQFNNYRKSLWLDYNPHEKKNDEFVLSSDFHASEYYLHSLAFINRNDTCWVLTNTFPPNEKYHSTICVQNIHDSSQKCITSFSSLFANGEVNYIYPQSVLYKNGIYYLLAAYDPDNDPTKDKYRLRYTTYLIQIKE